MPAPLSPVERLFVAVPLLPEARAAIGAALPRPLPGRPVPPENWHLTLHFLGDLPAVERDRLVRALDGVRPGAPFPLRLEGFGAFPRPSRARVLWLGAGEGRERLIDLRRRVLDAVRAAGLEGDAKPYTPHLTLARIDPPRDVTSLIAGRCSPAIETTIGEVVLFRSRPGAGPARHEAVRRYPLG
jgi:RNA 2',3'-cyclic 3'-phosphodiesterase